jgi:hypothetical protein
MVSTLDQAAAQMGVQPTPGENLFDDTRSASIAARYAAARQTADSSEELAATQRQAEADAQRKVAQERADTLWNRKAMELQEEDDFKAQRGDFLHSFATSLDPESDDFETKLSEFVANAPEGLLKDDAFQAMLSSKGRIFQRRQQDQLRDENVKAAHALRVGDNLKRLTQKAAEYGIPLKELEEARDPTTGEYDDMRVAELIGEKKGKYMDQKDVAAKRKAQATADVAAIFKLDPKNVALKNMYEAEDGREKLDDQLRAGLAKAAEMKLGSEATPFNPDDLEGDTRSQFVSKATTRFRFDDKGKGFDPKDLENLPKTSRYWQAKYLAQNIYDTYHTLKMREARDAQFPSGTADRPVYANDTPSVPQGPPAPAADPATAAANAPTGDNVVPEAAGVKPLFPTKHPYVKNKDGSSSNVVLAGFNIDGKEYVIPTMVGGEKLSNKEAIAVAKSHGLENYPSFATPNEASAFAEKIHGSVDENGALKTDAAGTGLPTDERMHAEGKTNAAVPAWRKTLNDKGILKPK